MRVGVCMCVRVCMCVSDQNNSPEGANPDSHQGPSPLSPLPFVPPSQYILGKALLSATGPSLDHTALGVWAVYGAQGDRGCPRRSIQQGLRRTGRRHIPGGQGLGCILQGSWGRR